MKKPKLRTLSLLLVVGWLLGASSATAERLCVDAAVTGSSGTAQDSGGSGGNYSNNERCGFLIRSSSGGAITLEFSSFSYEAGYDYLRVYDGTSTSGTLLLNATGSSRPASVTAPSGSMYIYHLTDNFVVASGFEATWTASSSTDARMCWNRSSSSSSGVLRDSGGSAGNYSSYENCGFLIQPAAGGDITLRFGSFDYENSYDFVRIYDGTSTSDRLLGAFTGSSLPADVTATSGAMLVTSRTDSAVVRPGFEAKWGTTPGNSCPDQYAADHFPSVSYNLNTGNQDWTTDWIEIGERDGPSTGISRVNSSNCSSGYCLRLGQPGSASSWSNIGVYREVDLSSATTATLTFANRTGYARGKEEVTLSASNDGGFRWTPLATYTVTRTSFTASPQTFDISKFIASNTQIRFLSSGSSATIGLYVDDIEINHDGLAPSCSSEDPDHFELVHDNSGIHCLDEKVAVTAKNADGTVTTAYVGTITLDTQTSTGSWSLVSGAGTLTDATSGDGLATYTFDSADSGEATFALSYKEGVASLDIDVHDGAIRDDDSEGMMTFAASGFTITASALSNPPPATINDPIGTQIAGTPFGLYVAAYGTTATDSECGVIESYTGSQTLSLTTDHQNPTSGTRTASGGGAVTFMNGQALIKAAYKDAGQIGLTVSDGTLSGGTGGFVVKPAGLVLQLGGSNQTAVDENGSIYTRAGVGFAVTVTAKDSAGDTTPNFGNESVPETLQLAHSLVAPAGGVNGTLGGSLARTGQGVFSGTVNWSEVGIINLVADLTDNDYLGAGNLTVNQPNVGRFVPNQFLLDGLKHGTLAPANQCTGSGGAAFTYTGQAFGFGVAPDFLVTAQSAGGTTTANYTGVYAKLDANSVDLPAIATDATALGSDGSTPLAITHTRAAMTHTDNGDGTHTYRLGSDSFSFDRTALAQVSAFSSDLDLDIASVLDGDAIRSDFSSGNRLSPASTEIRYGRLAATNALGSELVDLIMPVTLEVFNTGLGGFVHHTGDTCTPQSTATLTDLDAGDSLDATTVVTSMSGNLGGRYELTLRSPGAGAVGAALATLDAPLYLEYSWGTATDPEPSGVGTFGLFAGDSVIIYQRAVY